VSWQGIEGHDAVVEQFRRALRAGRLASSFLLVGPEGVGKRTFALKFAQALFCRTRPGEALDPCGRCAGCRQAAAGTHPDLAVVARPPDKSVLPLELLIGDKEHRGRAGLCHHLALRPLMGGRRIAVIDDADFLAAEGANCLLKTLEEPPPGSVLMLIGTSPARQLPTIRSRCQLVRFHPLPVDTLARLLVEQGIAADAADAERLARHSEGSMHRARELADPDLWTFRGEFVAGLSAAPLDRAALARSVSAFVDAAGKDAPARRARLRQVIAMAAGYYRQLLRAQSGLAEPLDAEADRLVAQAARAGGSRVEPTVARLERCLEAAAQVDRNAHQAAVIECWVDDLGRAAL
jgi:DNA polymerase III subunit delta'